MTIGRRKAGGTTLLVGAVLAPLVAAAMPAQGSGQQPAAVRATPRSPQDGWLGLQVLESLVHEQGRRTTSVIRVTGIFDDGPSAKAGLRPGDVVVRVNGRPAEPAVFNRVASSLAPGEEMRVVVERDGERRELRVTAAVPPSTVTALLPPEIAERIDFKLHRMDSLRVLLRREGGAAPRAPEGEPTYRFPLIVRSRVEPVTGAARPDSLRTGGRMVEVRAVEEDRPLLPWVEGQNWIGGARFTELNRDLAAYFGVDAGLLVTEIIGGTPVAEAGVRSGDVLVAVDGRPVPSLAAARAAIQRSTTAGLVLSLVRHGERIELELGS